MKPFHLLRIASIITLLYCAGHSAGFPWTPYTTPEAKSVIDAMKTHAFEEQGFKGTYWDIYIGFGLVISLALLTLAVILWQVASLARTDVARVRPIVATLLIAFLINTALACKFFFIIPVVMSVVIALCLAGALALAGRASGAASPSTYR